MKEGFVIAIDGPVATGKGTIAHLLADRLHAFDLWTGATYRCLALYCLENGIDLHDSKKVLGILSNVVVDIRENKVYLNGKEVTDRIVQPDVAAGSAITSSLPEVRRYMVAMQQEIAKRRLSEGIIVIAEGRDTATKAFPDAAMKIYLTAKVEVRAKRRLAQLIEKGEHMTVEQVLEEIKLRDKRDMERETDPLVSDPTQYGYFIVDNSDMTEEETIEFIITKLHKKGLLHD